MSATEKQFIVNPDYELVEYDESLSYEGYRHAAHCIVYAIWKSKALETYDTKAAVQMQIRSDGYIGFPGGMINEGESCIDGLNRELEEELNLDLSKYRVTDSERVFSHLCKKKKLVLHFYAKEVPLQSFRDIEIKALDAQDFNQEVFGNCRVPLFTMEDGYNGLPAYLNNNFIGNAKHQLLLTLAKKNILQEDEIHKAMKTANDRCRQDCKCE